jgi:hypothetical protein
MSNSPINILSGKVFFWKALFVSKSIYKMITDKLTDESFSDRLFSSMIMCTSFVLTDCEYKYR